DIAHVDEKTGSIFIGAYGYIAEEHPHYRKYYRVELESGLFEPINDASGHHYLHVSPNGSVMVNTWSRHDAPPQSILLAADGTKIMDLHQTDVSTLLEAGWRPPLYAETFAPDGETRLFSYTFLPFEKQDGASYPIISVPQPNPSGDGSLPIEFTPIDELASLAQVGFAVVTSTTRGQAQGVRSKSYLLSSNWNVRDYPLEDSRRTIEQLAERFPQFDINRVGVSGYSGGAFMGAALMLTYPEFYKAGAVGAGNHDNRISEMNSGEHYFGVTHSEGTRNKPTSGICADRTILGNTPSDSDQSTKQNIEAANKSAITVGLKSNTISEWCVDMDTNQALAHGLGGPLVVYHGDSDTDTHFQHSVRLADALIKAGKPFEFLVLPGEDHDIWSAGGASGYMERRLWMFFAKHLMDDHRWHTDVYALDKL
ncbi:MAG: prolyl oligopeptidase family serine peptidase, partial [Pseudomonadota bacterium]